MDTKKIMVPVIGALSSDEIERRSFWLARHQGAQLHIVEILPPVGLLHWLCTPLFNLLKRCRGSQAQRVRRHAMTQEKFPCEIGEIAAPNLVLGIVEAARREQPDVIILLPEIDERLGRPGSKELKNRLSEIRQYVLVKPGRGCSMRIEPHKKKALPDCKRVVPIDRNTWIV